MAKESFYFNHDYNARNDDKILELRSELGAEGYGIFWMILETMAENENGGVKMSLMGGLSHGYGVPIAKLKEAISLCIRVELFYEKEGSIFSKRLLQHKYIRKSLSDAGRAGAEKRWGGYSPPNGETMPKERKGNKNTLCPGMLDIFKTAYPEYPQDQETDFGACLRIAYKIAKANDWSKESVVNGKINETMDYWKGLVEFSKTDDWFSSRAISDFDKEFQRLVQKKNVAIKPSGGKKMTL